MNVVNEAVGNLLSYLTKDGSDAKDIFNNLAIFFAEGFMDKKEQKLNENDIKQWVERNNIDIQLLSNCILNGWEVK